MKKDVYPTLVVCFLRDMQVYSARRVAIMKMRDDGFEEKAKDRKKQKLKTLAERGLLNKRSKKRKREKKNLLNNLG